MIQNYLLLFVRNLLRQKLFSAINLVGLTVSITSTLLIFLYVSHEYSYDRFHDHEGRIYRINQTFIWGEDNESQFSRTGPGVAHALNDELAEVEATTSLHTPGSFLVSYTTPNNEVLSFEETKVFAADSNFFRVFSFPLISGDKNTAFKNENTLMLTKSTAEKYFGDADPIGKFLRLGFANEETAVTYEVAGVIEDVPSNSTIDFDVLLSNKNFAVEKFHWSWIWTQLETFILFKEGTDIANVREKLKVIPEKHAEETLQRAMNTSYKEYVASGKKWELFLQPISALHLPERYVISSFEDTGNRKVIYSLIGAGIFILFLSCINFMNLSTAQFTRRIREAGVRKILGLGKAELSIGYFAEALLFCLIAMVIAISLTQIILPGFNFLTGKELSLDFIGRPSLIVALVGVVVLMAGFSSLYPALFLSSFKPVEAVKGKIKMGNKGTTFRDGLLIFQFSASVILIVCTAVVFQQLNYVSEVDLGFDKRNLLQVKHAEGITHAESYVKSIENIAGVVSASLCTSAPPRIFGGDKFSAEGMNGEKFSLNFTTADENFIPTLNIKLLHGRNFLKESPSDINGVLVNEQTLKRLGWPSDESAIGRKIYYPGTSIEAEIIGVMADFNYWSLEVDIEPMAIFHINSNVYGAGTKRYVVVKLDTKSMRDWERIAGGIQAAWRQHAGDIPFEYGFVDEYFAEAFLTQQRLAYVLSVIASLAILIACLGLLGVIIYALEQRTKEIGIRKVSGATSWDIISLISGNYLKLILAALLIGSPIAYYLMEQWLEDFSYRITPSPYIFLFTGASTVALALLITTYHSLRAARRNPVEVLKDE